MCDCVLECDWLKPLSLTKVVSSDGFPLPVAQAQARCIGTSDALFLFEFSDHDVSSCQFIIETDSTFFCHGSHGSSGAIDWSQPQFEWLCVEVVEGYCGCTGVVWGSMCVSWV